MMLTFRRYLKAFIGALRLTLRGQQPPSAPAHPLTDWSRQTLRLLLAVRQAADAAGLKADARSALKVRIDGRAMSVETVLEALRFHAAQEYPSVLRSGTSSRIMNTIYATNMNDHYWVLKLLDAPGLDAPAVHLALQALAAHLENPPRPPE